MRASHAKSWRESISRGGSSSAEAGAEDKIGRFEEQNEGLFYIIYTVHRLYMLCILHIIYTLLI